MRKLRQLSMVVVLTLVLSASAFAGIIGGGPEPPPPPPEPASVTATGIIGTSPSEATSTVPVADITLALLQSLLSVL